MRLEAVNDPLLEQLAPIMQLNSIRCRQCGLEMSRARQPWPTNIGEEMDAKLATVEARTETRFMELSGKIDRVAIPFFR